MNNSAQVFTAHLRLRLFFLALWGDGLSYFLWAPVEKIWNNM